MMSLFRPCHYHWRYLWGPVLWQELYKSRFRITSFSTSLLTRRWILDLPLLTDKELSEDTFLGLVLSLFSSSLGPSRSISPHPHSHALSLFFLPFFLLNHYEHIVYNLICTAPGIFAYVTSAQLQRVEVISVTLEDSLISLSCSYWTLNRT